MIRARRREQLCSPWIHLFSLCGRVPNSEDPQRADLETGPTGASTFSSGRQVLPLEHRPFPDEFDAAGRTGNGRSVFENAITWSELAIG